MCGIAGFYLSPNERPINSRRLAAILLHGIEHRGRDATGAAWHNNLGRIEVQKAPVTATQFTRSLSIPRRAEMGILHTRAWTQGVPSFNENNHPVSAGSIVGVHNGTVWNDWDLWREMGVRDRQRGEVDSEALFAALAWGTEEHPNGGTRLPKCRDHLDALERIEGMAAVAWLDREDETRTMHLARISGSPLVMVQTSNGSLIFASERGAIDDALQLCRLEESWEQVAQEGEYVAVRNGRIVEFQKFEPAPRWGKYSGSTTTGITTNLSQLAGSGKPATPKAPVKSVKPADVPAASSYLLGDADSRYLDESVYFTYDNDRFFDHYFGRVAAIDDYYFPRTSSDDDVMEDRVLMHADARPGDWVRTTVAGEEVWAQVYLLPDTYPDGAYVLLARVPVEEGWLDARVGGSEVVMVRRHWSEFWLSPRITESTVDAVEQQRLVEVVDDLDAQTWSYSNF